MKMPWHARPTTLAALVLSIPAFYLVLTGPSSFYQNMGRLMYATVALLLACDLAVGKRFCRLRRADLMEKLDALILPGALASAIPTPSPWSNVEWLLRLGFCALVFLRLMSLLSKYLMPHKLLVILSMAGIGLAIAGAGFYWLEPKVQNYADGVWLAFVTGATVGYGDLVPSTPASRIFSVFIVLLGYALFSMVTASIAALMVGEDEKRLAREMHADMKQLRKEIALLRQEMKASIVEQGASVRDQVRELEIANAYER
jgi:voltage-gated potassium channel